MSGIELVATFSNMNFSNWNYVFGKKQRAKIVTAKNIVVLIILYYSRGDQQIAVASEY